MSQVASHLRTREPAAHTPLVVVGLAVGVAALLGTASSAAPIWALLGAAALVAGLVLVARPEYAGGAVAFLLWANVPVVAVREHGVPKLAASGYILLLLLPIGRAVLIERRGLALTKALPWVGLYAGFMLLSSVFARDPDRASEAAIELMLEGVLILLLVTQAIRDRASLRRMTWGLLGAGAFMGAIALVQQLTGQFDSNFGGFGLVDSEFATGEITTQGQVSQKRLAGPIGEKNRFGQIMLVVVALAVGVARSEPRAAARRMAYLCGALSAIGTALTFSRGNAVAFAMLLAVMASIGTVQKRQIAIAAGGGILLLLMLPQYRARLATIGSVLSLADRSATAAPPDGAVLGRATEVIAAVLVYVDHPVLGVGPGLFKSYSQEYGNQLGLRRLRIEREAHTMFPHVAAEGGTLGLGTFCAALFVTMLALRRIALRTQNDRDRGLADAYFLAIAAYMAGGVFLHMSFIRYFWFLLGAASAAAHVLETRTERDGAVDTEVIA